MGAGDPGAAAIVTTLRNAGAVLDSFVAYHRAIGFAHLYLFFDDPNDPDLARARTMPDVTAVPHDAALRAQWRSLPSWVPCGGTIDSEVMSRQILNVEIAMRLGREARFAWLLNIDSDELFLAPPSGVAGHFAWLSATPSETACYPNWEAIPEREEIGDFFREVELFKLPLAWAKSHRAREMAEAACTTPQLQPYFHFYGNGKSAVRLAASGLRPISVHQFGRSAAPTIEAQCGDLQVLHYACCGFETFWTKYVTLGAFPDAWWGRLDIRASIGPFHLEARDAVARGRDAALAFYRQRVALSDVAKADALIRAGLVRRKPEPRQIIARARL